MKGEIRILMLEDNQDDVELTRIALAKEGIRQNLTNITSESELKAENLQEYDVILCDYSLITYDGLSAVKYIREHSSIPIIVVSATIDRELGFDLMEAGADDFVEKCFMKRLPLLINKVMEDSCNKEKLNKLTKKIDEVSQMFDTLFDGLENPVFIKNFNAEYERVNAAFCKLYEWSESELIGKTDGEIDWAHHNEQSSKDDAVILSKGVSTSYELDYETDSGRKIWLEVIKNPILIDGEIKGILGQARDITRRKSAETNVEKSQRILFQAEELAVSGSFEYDADLDLLTCSKNLAKMLGIQSSQISLGRLVRLVKKEDRDIFMEGIHESIELRKEYRMLHRYQINVKVKGHFEILFRPDYRDKEGTLFYGTIIDRTKESKESISRITHLEESRNEIARELHDNFGQKLTAVSMLLKRSEEPQKCDNVDSCNDSLKESQFLIKETMDDLRKMLANISTKDIDDMSFCLALGKLTKYLPQSIKLDYQCNIEEEKVSKFVKIQAFRVIQETVNNATKYSDATNMRINVNHEGSILSLFIEDDGVGFDIKESELGNGLLNITHRVRRTNGLINIDSQKGSGTRIEVKMPVN